MYPIFPGGASSVRMDVYVLTHTVTGVAHKSTADDEYNGYHIPAGSIVIGNTSLVAVQFWLAHDMC